MAPSFTRVHLGDHPIVLAKKTPLATRAFPQSGKKQLFVIGLKSFKL